MDLCKRNSKNFVNVLSIGAFTLIINACSGETNGNTVALSEVSMQSLSCPTSQTKSLNGEMAIENTDSAAVGDAIQYKLNTDALCSGAQKVVWTAPGAKSISNKAAALSATYSAPGDYYVEAKLIDSSSVTTQSLVTQVVVMGEEIQFSGRQVTTKFFVNDFSLTVPAGVTLRNVVWNFGDGITTVTTTGSTSHAYNSLGVFPIKVTATTIDDVVTVIDQTITVIQDTDELFCASQLLVSSPTQTHVGDDNVMSIFIPTCLQSYLQDVTWSYGDTTSGLGSTVHKIYSAVGDYTIQASIRLKHPLVSVINVTRHIQVNQAVIVNICPTEGQTKSSFSSNYDETESCGIGGHKTVTYHDRKIETCQRINSVLDWALTSSTKEKVSEGLCQGQSCPVPGAVPSGTAGLEFISGQYYLADGGSFSFYTSESPLNSCSDNKETRTCSNGVLSGSGVPVFYQCQSGCGDFGLNGTLKTGLQVGTRQIPVQCSFGEQGIFDVYNEIEDRMCANGSVTSSNLRLGDIISKGQCPTYSYQPSNQYTACSANCGGSQSLIYECRNNSGDVVGNERCVGQPYPETTRLCDANPEAVRRVDSSSLNEQVPSQNKCPTNQIGTIVQNRDVITKNTYACINHSVQLESSDTEYTPWIEERYCRDYVAHRCSQDSLNNTDAHRRYLWMKKCAPQNPMIAEFLENFDDVDSGKGDLDGSSTGRTLYPTFLNSSYKPEKPWKAPVLESASCEIPEGAYIAAVCVSSCTLPEEKIIAQATGFQKMGPVEFVKALTQNYSRVATLSVNSSLESKRLKNSTVEQWVTELIETEQPVLVFKMASGNSLSITPNHPVLREDGSMDSANHFKVGDSLIKLGGEIDPIVSIDPIQYYGKVYNLFVKSAEPKENIVVTNGYLNGTAFFQNEGASLMNKKMIRKKLTNGIFEK